MNYALGAQGHIKSLVSNDDVKNAMVSPPLDTRAYFRGRIVSRFSSYVRSINWDMIEFEVDGNVRSVNLKNCISLEAAHAYKSVIDSTHDIRTLLEGIDRLNKGDVS